MKINRDHYVITGGLGIVTLGKLTGGEKKSVGAYPMRIAVLGGRYLARSAGAYVGESKVSRPRTEGGIVALYCWDEQIVANISLQGARNIMRK